jgi:hypothetical protein
MSSGVRTLQSDGIVAAETSPAMRTTEKVNKFAGSGQKKLPVENFSDPATEDIHTNQGQGTKMPEPTLTGGGSGIDPSNLPSLPGQRDLASESLRPQNDVESRGSSPAQYVVQEISRNAFQLRQLGAGQMQVVLKPDATTELALHLSLRNGVVEAQAQFQQGDQNSLNSYWKELRLVLAQQGVHLMPLREPTAASHQEWNSPGRHWFEQSASEQRSGHQRPDFDLEEPSTTGSRMLSTDNRRAPAAVAYRGGNRWESWA